MKCKIAIQNHVHFFKDTILMESILFHIMSGPNNVSKSMLGFLLARTAVEEGHKVEIFLSGDGVQLVRNTIIDNLVGLGTGKLKEHMAVLTKKGVTIYVSSMSCENRGVTNLDLKGKKIRKVLPKTLLDLVLSTDKTLIY